MKQNRTFTNRLITMLIMAGCVCLSVRAGERVQASEKLKPQWMSGIFPKNHNSSYYFKVTEGEGATLAEAKVQAMTSLILDLAAAQGVTIKGNAIERLSEENRNDVYNTHTEFQSTFTFDYDSFHAAFTQVDIYWEKYRNGTYTCWVLFEVAHRASHVKFEEIRFTEKYGARGLVRSLIPGVGQLYKGSKVKGALIMGGTVTCAGAIVVAENLRSTYVKRMEERPQYKDFYNKKADNWTNVRNACIGVTAALYIYNLIDAAVAPGRKRAVVTSGKPRYALLPACDAEQVGLAFVVRF